MTSLGTLEPEPADPAVSRRKVTRWVIGICLGTCLVLLTLLGINFLVDVPLTISPETTYLTEPRTPDGRWIDYLAALEQRRYPAEMRTDDNGARLIVRALGPGANATPLQREQVPRKLGLNPADPPTLTYEQPYDFLTRYSQDLAEQAALPSGTTAGRFTSDLEDRLDQPWTLNDLPMMEAWLSENGPALDLISQAVQRPAFCYPYVKEPGAASLLVMPIDHVTQVRGYARGLAARARYRMGIGDIDPAIDDILATVRLGRRLQQDGFLIELLIGLAVESIGRHIGFAAAENHPPSAEQLQRLRDELDRLPPCAPLERFTEAERYMWLQFVQGLAQGDWSNVDYISEELRKLQTLGLPMHRIGQDWNVVLRRTNSNYEALLNDDPPPASPPLWQALFRGPRSVLLADALSREFFTTLEQIREAMQKAVCGQRLQCIVIALLLYEREYGTLPPAWTVDAEGNRLHSWRVLILPQLGEPELYAKIRLDEPWDSPHNRTLRAAADHLYQCPSSHGLAAGETTYAVVEGPGGAFEGAAGQPLSELGSGRAERMLVVERDQAANWMDPTQEVPLANATLGINTSGLTGSTLGSPHPGGIQVGTGSGAVEFVSENIDRELLRQRLDGTPPMSEVLTPENVEPRATAPFAAGISGRPED